MSKQKLSKLKSNVKHRMPEIVSVLSVVGGIVALVCIKKTLHPDEFYIAITPEQADSILVLEQVGVSTYKDLDFGDMFSVTPIPK